MSLDTGTRIGAYEIVSLLGKGGMGEVYVARDPRLGRRVALKVLPGLHTYDSDRIRRFEQEAQAAAHINHAGILSIYDIGKDQDIPYIVTELLEGENLRDLLQRDTPVSWRKSVDIGIQATDALAFAHRNGIIHRDIKPENLFLTRDNRLKILDFGLAKLLPERETGSQIDTHSFDTGEGVVIGTVGYMSPEQLKGLPVDERTDIFSVGAVLYELLSGQPAFQGTSVIERIASILNQEPKPLQDEVHSIPPGLGRIVHRCLQKDPDRRYQSIRDVGFALEEILLAGDAQTDAPQHAASYRRLTFRKGFVWSARFAPDGNTIIYGGCWDGDVCSLYMSRTDTPESLHLAMPPADILSISRNGEMLICLNRSYEIGYTSRGTLARVPMIGGAPREIMENVQDADWLPNGRDVAVVRHLHGWYVLEFPMGNPVYRSSGWISNARVSPNGERVAFLDHPVQGDDAGSVAIVDRAGNKRTLTQNYGSMQGCAWAGEEIWFSGTDSYINREIYGVTLSGDMRWVLRVPSSVTIHDISPAGNALLTHDSMRREMMLETMDRKQQNLSYLNWSFLRDISPDGQWVLFQEQAGGLGGNAICIRKLDGSPAIQLGQGYSTSFTDDGKWIVSIQDDLHKIHLLPVGPSAPRTIHTRDLECNWAGAMRTKNSLLVSGRKGTQKENVLYRVDMGSGFSEQISDEPLTIPKTFSGACIAPTGDTLAAWDPDRNLKVVPLNGSPSFLLPGLRNYMIAGWTPDGATILVYRPEGSRVAISRVEIQTGKMELQQVIEPSDGAGIAAISPIVFSPFLDRYIYSFRRILSDLYVARNLK